MKLPNLIKAQAPKKPPFRKRGVGGIYTYIYTYTYTPPRHYETGVLTQRRRGAEKRRAVVETLNR